MFLDDLKELVRRLEDDDDSTIKFNDEHKEKFDRLIHRLETAGLDSYRKTLLESSVSSSTIGRSVLGSVSSLMSDIKETNDDKEEENGGG